MENSIDKQIQTENIEPDWEFWSWAAKVEKDWIESLPRFTDKELLGIFPEAKTILPLKIREWKEELCRVRNLIKSKLRVIYRQSDPGRRWVGLEVLKQSGGQRFTEIQRHIMRLQKQLAVSQDRKPKDGAITQERVQQALFVPLADIVAQRMKLRKSGKTFTGLCPFHNEKTSSFHIYPADNRFYCFGCQKGGNVINFVRELEGLSFREAIEYLTR